jgi:antibiotic biosynthesis monooxygenase (ABM) superfamily enzyme
MIKRIWHGYTTPERADEYEQLLRSEVMKEIEGKNIPGLRRFEVLRRPLGDEIEFITIMEFETLDSVKAFVGEDYEACYVPAAARAVLKRFDTRSQHYDLRDVRAYA